MKKYGYVGGRRQNPATSSPKLFEAENRDQPPFWCSVYSTPCPLPFNAYHAVDTLMDD